MPRNLFYKALRGEASFVLVPTCRDCNGSFSHDEEYFGNFMVLAGSQSKATEGVFHGPMVRSLRREGHGKGMLRGVLEMIRPGDPVNLEANRIYPDERILGVVRKITRGLCFEHFGECVPEGRILAVVNPWQIKPEILEAGEWQVIHPQVFRYSFETEDLGPGFRLGWYLEFFRTVSFVSMVTENS